MATLQYSRMQCTLKTIHYTDPNVTTLQTHSTGIRAFVPSSKPIMEHVNLIQVTSGESGTLRFFFSFFRKCTTSPTSSSPTKWTLELLSLGWDIEIGPVCFTIIPMLQFMGCAISRFEIDMALYAVPVDLPVRE